MRFVALLRGINVGGTGILPMKELALLCEKAGCTAVRTYIQSGNVVFESKRSEAGVKAALETVLAERMGKRIDVKVRTAAELRAIVEGAPFDGLEPAKIGIAFLDENPQADVLERVVAPGGEQVRLGERVLYLYFPDGMGRSKLKLPVKAEAVTIRNLNTVRKLAELAAE